MSVLLRVPIILILLVLGAHFLRSNLLPLVAGCLVLIILLFVPNRWVMRFIQIVLILGALEWLHTILVLYNQRHAAGEPWLRMALILGGVAAITAASAALFETKTLRRRYMK